MNILSIFKKKETVKPGTFWRMVAVIDLSKPWKTANEKLVLAMDILDRASKDGKIQWRMLRDGDQAAFEAYCNEREWQKIQDIFQECQ